MDMAQDTATRARQGKGRPRCAGSVQDIINTLLTLERLTTTFYYAGLTSPHVMHNRALGGPSADPNNPGLPPGGHPSSVRYLQAALDAEVKHAAALVSAGARSPYGHFYFPSRTFTSLGVSTHPGQFLGVMDVLETMCEGLYLAAARDLLQLGYPDVAAVAAQIMGVESEHRTLGRIISGIQPPMTGALLAEPFPCIDGADATLRSFLLGERYPHAHGPMRAMSAPTDALVRHVVGKYGTHRVRRFLWT